MLSLFLLFKFYSDESYKGRTHKLKCYRFQFSKGGVISIEITWNCDLDHDISKCKPKYSFSRLDDPNAKLAAGWNFRWEGNNIVEKHIRYICFHKKASDRHRLHNNFVQIDMDCKYYVWDLCRTQSMLQNWSNLKIRQIDIQQFNFVYRITSIGNLWVYFLRRDSDLFYSFQIC